MINLYNLKKVTFWNLLIGMLISWLAFQVCKIGFYSYRNYQGHCLETSLKTNDRTIINNAIANLFIYYPKDEKSLRYFLRASGASDSAISLSSKPINYGSIAEFTKLNNDCCQILSRPIDIEASPASFFERITGSVSSFVQVRYLLRYFDKAGQMQQRQMEVTYAVNNCGVVWNKN